MWVSTIWKIHPCFRPCLVLVETLEFHTTQKFGTMKKKKNSCRHACNKALKCKYAEVYQEAIWVWSGEKRWVSYSILPSLEACMWCCWLLSSWKLDSKLWVTHVLLLEWGNTVHACMPRTWVMSLSSRTNATPTYFFLCVQGYDKNHEEQDTYKSIGSWLLLLDAKEQLAKQRTIKV